MTGEGTGTSAPSTSRAPGEPLDAGSTPGAVAADPSAGPDTVRGGGYGNIYTPHAGSMIIQVQRESGLQSRTIVLTGRQVRVLRFIMSRAGKILAAAAAAIAVLLIVEAARVPSLVYRISRMEHTAQRLDTLERSLSEVQKRYDQVRTMMGGDAGADGVQGAGGPVGFAPAPSISTRSSAGAAGARAAADPTPPAGDRSGDSTTGATPAVHPGRARHARAPAPVVVPPPPDSGAPPSPQAEPQ